MKPCKHGHMSGRGAQNRCLECDRLRKVGRVNKEKQRARYHSNKEFIKAQTNKYRRSHPEKKLLWNAGRRARKGGYLCTITLADVVIPKFCPLLGVKLKVGGSGQSPASASLDKIIPALGYVPGNVWVISWRANTLKSNATWDELYAIAINLKAAVEKFPWERK